MSNIPPIEDGYIDSVIKSSGPLKPNLNKTQGIELRSLVKLLRDRLEGEISDHYLSNQAALSEKANIDQVLLKTTKVNGKPLYGDITLDKNDVGLGNVDNTSDLDKPLSSFAQAALALKADMVDVNDKLSLKVDKVSGKQLSTEDFSSDEKDKLAGIQNGATANESNAYLLGREHHTGSQAIETIVGLRTELDDKLSQSEKGQGNGIATLDVNGKIPLGQLNEAILGSVNYQGNYDASANNPLLPAAAGNKGKYYVVAVAGNQQGLDLNIGDWIISNGDVWQRVDNNNKVTSVNGKQGAVILGKADIGLNNIDNTADSSKPVSTAQQAALDGKANSNGTNAAGVWGIDINGNANTVTALNRPQVFAVVNGSDLGSNTLNVNIFGRSAYSDRIGNGSADMAFHWQGQSGQPNWLWGSNEAGNMYVYNPANFNVQNAIQWNGVSINWADDSGTNLNDIIGIDTNTGSASRYNASYIKNWLNLDNTFQPLENQRLSNTNAVQFQSVFLNEYVSTPKIDLRGVTNPSFIQGNDEFIDVRPSSDVRFLNIINNDTPSVVIHARDGQVDMALLVSNNIQNAGRTSTGTLTLTATSQDVADIDKVLVGKLGTGDAYWASNNYFKNNILGLGSAAYLNGSGGDDAIQFGHVVKYNSSGFIRTAAKDHPQPGGLTALYGSKGEDDFVWAFNNDAVKAFLNYNGSQIYSDVSNVNADIQVSKYMRWKQHGSGHVIFDASAGTSPTGASIDRNNPQVQADGGVNPVLMGWNGVNTYGVRVDSARLADHSLNTDKWAGLSRTAGIVNNNEIGYLHILNGSGDNSGFADRNTIKSWLGLNTENQWNVSAGDIDLNALSDFTVQESYGASSNVPFGQQYNLVVNFKSPSAQRGLQLASYYGSVDHFYVRSKFDATGQWKAWKEVVTHDQLNLQLITNGGTITNQPIGVNMYDGQPASTISLAIGDNDTGFQRGGDGVTGYYSNSNLLYNLNDPASIRNFLNLNTNQDPIFRNLTANEAHLSRIWSFYGEASVNNYSWTDAAFTTTSIEIVTSGNNTYTDKAPTLAFHRYGSGGPQFRLDPTGTNVLYLESANVNSSRNGVAYGGGNNSYFTEFVIDGKLQSRGRFKTYSNAFIGANDAFGIEPNVTLAIGDSDTGLHWTADGNVQWWSNNQALYNMQDVWRSNNFDPSLKANTSQLQLQYIRNYGGAELWSESNISTSYTDATLQLRESQRGASIGFLAPRLSFHWGGVVASQLTIESNGRIAVMNNPGTAYENFVANNVYGANDVSANYTYGQIFTSGGRIWTGFDSGVTGSISASNWFRSNGNTGWYNETHQGGIYMEDTTWVKVYNGKAFMVNNEVNANRMVVNTDSFKSTSFKGMAGDYDQNGTTDKIVWTIGDNWATIQNMYGIGYQYETKYGNAHSIVFRVSGNVTSAINLENGNGYFDGKVSAGTGSNGGFGNTTYVQGHNNIWRLHSDPEYGIAYFQNWGTADNLDAVGFHFGDRNNPMFYVRADGELHMGNGKGSSSLVMHDIDDSTRILHTNSNRIGFLTSGGSWGSYCENDGGWRTETEFRVANTKVNGGGINITAGNGNGIGFWESGSAGAYSIWMGDTNTYGGNLSGDGSNDYNMYFRMTSANRGFVFRTGSGQDTLQITNNKVTVNGFVNASGGFYDTSDKRLKIETDQVFDARGIKAYTYFKNEQLETGYYAQDIEPLMPHAIKQDDNGFLSLSYTQVLVAKVANLEDDVKRLQEEINFLKLGI